MANARDVGNRRFYRLPRLDQKLETVLALAFHILVVGGVALTAAGSAKLQNHDQPFEKIEKAEKIVKAGIAILAVAWGVLVGFAALSFTAPRATNSSSVMRAGTVVSYSSLPFEMLGLA